MCTKQKTTIKIMRQQLAIRAIKTKAATKIAENNLDEKRQIFDKRRFDWKLEREPDHRMPIET